LKRQQQQCTCKHLKSDEQQGEDVNSSDSSTDTVASHSLTAQISRLQAVLSSQIASHVQVLDNVAASRPSSPGSPSCLVAGNSRTAEANEQTGEATTPSSGTAAGNEQYHSPASPLAFSPLAPFNPSSLAGTSAAASGGASQSLSSTERAAADQLNDNKIDHPDEQSMFTPHPPNFVAASQNKTAKERSANERSRSSAKRRAKHLHADQPRARGHGNSATVTNASPRRRKDAAKLDGHVGN